GKVQELLRLPPNLPPLKFISMTFLSSYKGCVRTIGVCLAVLSVPGYARAQVGGSISGTIKDTSGGVIPGATVLLMNTARATQLMSISDTAGHYSFPNVPVGRYDLIVTLEGFKPNKRAGVAVDTDSRLQIDAMLEIGEQTETVTVTENAIHVETAS